MTFKQLALGSAAAIAFVGLLGAVPASAFTHHPATPEEIRQTDALNAQSLAAAQAGTQPTFNDSQTTGAASDAAMPNSDSNASKPSPDEGTTPNK